jgi:hypothetical protein
MSCNSNNSENVSSEIINFFGASVTQQQNGFAVYLSKKLKSKTNIYGYGGNHLNDAGICNIDIVLETNPNYCFIDFFSTGLNSINDIILESLDTIVYKFTKSNCKLIFLFLLRIDHTTRYEFYNFLKKYLDSKKIYYIDINDYLEFNEILIRDTVHTTDVGSEKYAEIIYDIFKENKPKIEYPTDIIKTRFCDIKILNVNKIFKEEIILECQDESMIIAAKLLIGTKSGIIEINNEKMYIWDIWCHYDRINFKIKHQIINGKMPIKILQDKIDYSECKREMNYHGLKELNILEIYYIGDDLNIFGI